MGRGIILESVLEGYAEYYSADLSEKVVRGMTENALKSKYNGGTRPIGYLIDSDQYFQLDPLTAPFVREAFQRYDEGATMTAIRDWLNEQGVKNTRGQKMTYNSVQHLLNNRRYIGEYTYRDIVVPDGIPAIVPQDFLTGCRRNWQRTKSPGPPQGRGRLSADHKAVLWHLRGHDGWRERHQRQQGPEIPLLSLCKHQETKKAATPSTRAYGKRPLKRCCQRCYGKGNGR